MKKTQILVVEDNPSTSGMLNDTLLKIPGIECFVAPQPSIALSLIQKKTYDLVFIDLMLSPTSEHAPRKAIYNGIQLGEDIRKSYPPTVIIMYSMAVDAKNVRAFEYYDLCLEAGADEVIGGEFLQSLNAAKLGQKIAEWIEQRKSTLVDTRPLTPEGDWATKALFEIVGEDALSRIIHQLIPQATKDHVKALNAGYSGASVAMVTSKAELTNNTVENVIKICRTRQALDDELRRLPTIGSALDVRSETPHTGCVEAHGWYGFACRAVKDSILLRDYLLRKPALAKRPDQLRLSALIERLLVTPASESCRREDIKIGDQLMGYAFGHQVLEKLSEIGKWKAPLMLTDKEHLHILAGFIRNALNGHWNLCGHYHVAKLHGDFHCRNVFISNSAPALLIDFGRSEMLPRLLDFAALDADILISLLGSDDGADLYFDGLNGWLDEALKGYPFVTETREFNGQDTKLTMLRKLLHQKLLSGLANVTPIEYTEALLFQMLRYMRFPTTTAPKQLLAAEIAFHLVTKLGFVT